MITHEDRYFHLADRSSKLDYGKIETRHSAAATQLRDVLIDERVRAGM